MTNPDQNIFRRSLLDRNEFTITYELVPGRGSSGKRLENLLQLAESAQKDGRIKALSITDNPGGHPALSPTSLGLDIQKIGITPLLHFSLKDKNRNMVESQLFECHRHNLINLLTLGGDFPRYGFKGQAMPVFDLDSPQLLSLISSLREDHSIKKGAPGKKISMPPMDFFAGCVVSPFKNTEAEQVWQYTKLLTKVKCGAQFVISQLGFDMLKYRELVTFIADYNLNIPIIANIFVPSLPVARVMNKGLVPGVHFPDLLVRRMEQEAKNHDGGQEARLNRAAKMISVLQSTGYDGVHIGGNNLDFDAISFILDRAEQIKADETDRDIHFPCPNNWYLKKDCRHKKRKPTFMYRGNNLIHHHFFSREGLFFSLARSFSLTCLKNKTTVTIYTAFEHFIKKLIFRCRMCGDCTLSESNYLCPQSGCPKRMINGPCGGSINGYCEVYPKERLCFWVRSYRNGTNPDCGFNMSNELLPPKDWSLNHSSSWLNYFSGKDHCRLADKDL